MKLKEMLKDREMLEVFVKPNKQRCAWTGFDPQGRLVVELSAQAIEDRANLQLIKFFKLEGIRVSIKRGFKDRRKLVMLKWDS
jgi:uncharacterized protein YggU (UPF0235/DUF167 family)